MFFEEAYRIVLEHAHESLKNYVQHKFPTLGLELRIEGFGRSEGQPGRGWVLLKLAKREALDGETRPALLGAQERLETLMKDEREGVVMVPYYRMDGSFRVDFTYDTV